MRVLVACEFSGIVRDAFRKMGHDAWSCDLLPTENGDHHLHGDIFDVLELIPHWDLLIAFPSCQFLAVSGARWFKSRQKEQDQAIAFVKRLWYSDVRKISIENPISVLSTKWRKPDQIIQPWMFGHGETKATCLWLKNLPKLEPTNVVAGREARIHKMAPSPDRAKNRSRTFQGIADAMAKQWGYL